MRQKFAILLLAILGIGSGNIALWAASPEEATVTPGSTAIITWNGTAVGGGALNDPAAGLIGGEDLCEEGVSCDTFTLRLSGTQSDWIGKGIHIELAWSLPVSDFDMYVHKNSNDGPVVIHSAGGATSEDPTHERVDINAGTCDFSNTYTVHVVYYTAAAADQYSGTVNVINAPVPPPPSEIPPAPVAPAFAPRFFNYKPPSGLGEDAGEPTLGVNFKNGNVMYVAWLETLRASFDDRSSPANQTWFNRSFIATNVRSNDPILFTDPQTGRTFVSQLIFPSKQSLSAFTDDDGESWTISQGSGINSGVDHQTIGGGIFNSNVPGGTSLTDYRNAVYYAAQDVALAEIGVSRDGGLTYGPAVPMYSIADCAGIHGHIKVSPVDGTVYVPLGSCIDEDAGGHDEQAVAVSEDNGTTWNVRRIDGSFASSWDPSVGVGKNGKVYFGFGDNGDSAPKVAVSDDKGLTWKISTDLGAEHSIRRIAFPSMVAGDDNRAAFAFLGTTGEGEALGSGTTFKGVWHVYVATTYDGGDTWVTVNATGNDPVQRGNICDLGLSCPAAPNTRNLLDFMDVQMDEKGRILVAYADGCVSPDCIAGVDRNTDGCVDALDNDSAAKAAIARQSGGQRLLAQFDPAIPSAPAPPMLVAAMQGQAAHLSWSTPDDGGSPITGYKIFRNGTLLSSVSGDVNSYTDPVSSAAMSYAVAALNALGEGSKSLAVTAVVPDSPCAQPGIKVAEDTLDNPPNVPAQPSVDLKTIHLAEPYGDGTGQLHFTLAVGPGAVPPNSQWYILWQRTTPDETHDRNYVAMKSDLLGNLSFEHGRVTYPLVPTSPAANQGNLPTRFGSATGSHDAAKGLIRISVPTSAVDNVSAGAALLSMEARSFLGRNDGLPINQNATSDFSPAGSYTIVGNASCLQPPVAPTALAASTKKGQVTLTWNDNSSDETAFVVERSLSPLDGFVEIATVGANTRTYIDKTAVKKSTYHYRVRAENGPAKSAYSNIASIRVK